MNFCRYSCENWSSMIYAYQSADGFIIHVTDNMPVGRVPAIPARSIEMETLEYKELYTKAVMKQMKFFKTCDHAPIGLKHDGETFIEHSLEKFKERMNYLETMGYQFPQRVYQMIDHQIKLRRGANSQIN